MNPRKIVCAMLRSISEKQVDKAIEKVARHFYSPKRWSVTRWLRVAGSREDLVVVVCTVSTKPGRRWDSKGDPGTPARACKVHMEGLRVTSGRPGGTHERCRGAKIFCRGIRGAGSDWAASARPAIASELYREIQNASRPVHTCTRKEIHGTTKGDWR